jgi:NADH-quinone oxidoreductase subunit H
MIFSGSLSGVMIYFEQAFWLLLKSFLVIFVMIWVRATLPRMASFDLLKFSWSILLPLSILNLFLMVVFKILTGGVYA